MGAGFFSIHAETHMIVNTMVIRIRCVSAWLEQKPALTSALTGSDCLLYLMHCPKMGLNEMDRLSEIDAIMLLLN